MQSKAKWLIQSRAMLVTIGISLVMSAGCKNANLQQPVGSKAGHDTVPDGGTAGGSDGGTSNASGLALALALGPAVYLADLQSTSMTTTSFEVSGRSIDTTNPNLRLFVYRDDQSHNDWWWMAWNITLPNGAALPNNDVEPFRLTRTGPWYALQSGALTQVSDAKLADVLKGKSSSFSPICGQSAVAAQFTVEQATGDTGTPTTVSTQAVVYLGLVPEGKDRSATMSWLQGCPVPSFPLVASAPASSSDGGSSLDGGLDGSTAP